MSIMDPLITELQHEAAGARKVLERIPEEHYGWKPHAKSMSMGRLASHVAESFQWLKMILERDEFVMDPAGYKPFEAPSRAALLERFDSGLKEALAAMRGRSDAEMTKIWRLKVGGRTVIETPRAGVVRTMVLNHLIHHRGQLTVYLRLKDVAVPALYGPTADEPAPY